MEEVEEELIIRKHSIGLREVNDEEQEKPMKEGIRPNVRQPTKHLNFSVIRHRAQPLNKCVDVLYCVNIGHLSDCPSVLASISKIH